MPAVTQAAPRNRHATDIDRAAALPAMNGFVTTTASNGRPTFSLAIRIAVAACLAIGGIVLALAGPWDMIDRGPFGWHVRQPAFWQGGIELIVLACLIGGSLYFLRSWYRILAVLVLCELYARRQGVDLAIVMSLFYYEGIAALGTLILNRVGRLELGRTERCLFGITLGTLTWCCIEWIMSAFGAGSVRALQIAAVLVAGTSLILLRRPPVLSCVLSRVGHRSLAGALTGTFVCTIVLMLFAKASANLIDFDAMWYGLRGDRVLVAAGSVFKGLGLVTPVNYTPQAYELMLTPLDRTGSITAILGFSIWCWLGLGICLYAIAERLQWHEETRLWACGIALATPVVLNISLTAKGTVMAATWIFFGAYALIRFRATRAFRWIVLALVTACVASMFRASSFVYAAVIGVVGLAYIPVWLRRHARVGAREDTQDGYLRLWAWFIVAGVILIALVTARTLMLTGLPLYGDPTLMRLAERAGFELRFPVQGPAPVGLAVNHQFAYLLAEFLVAPGRLHHVAIEWTGAAFFYFLLVGLAARLLHRQALPNAPELWLLGLTFPAFLLFFHFLYPGGDGNYFLAAIVSMTLLGMWMLDGHFSSSHVVGRTLRWVASLFLVSFVSVAFVTGLWGPGTRAWDLDFQRPAHDYRARADAGLAAAHLQQINAYFHGFPRKTRVVGIVPIAQGNDLPGAWLPVRYESMRYIQAYAPGFLHDAAAAQQFLRRDRIQYVFLPRTLAPAHAMYRLTAVTEQALRDLRRHDLAAPVFRDEHYVLWELDATKPAG